MAKDKHDHKAKIVVSKEHSEQRRKEVPFILQALLNLREDKESRGDHP